MNLPDGYAWAFPSNGTRWHVIANDHSLCGKWAFPYDVDDPALLTIDEGVRLCECKVCHRRALAATLGSAPRSVSP